MQFWSQKKSFDVKTRNFDIKIENKNSILTSRHLYDVKIKDKNVYFDVKATL